MGKFKVSEIKTPVGIKLTLIPFIIYIFLKIGDSNTDSLTQITLVLFYLWIGSVFLFKRKAVIQILRQRLYLVLFFFLLFLFFGYAYANGIFTTIKGMGAYLQVFSPIFMYEFYSKYLSRITKRNLILFTLCIYIFYSYQTLQYLESNPLASRDMVSVGVTDSLLIGGGFSLAYGFSILIPILLYLTVNHSKFKNYFFVSNLFTRILIYLLVFVFFVVVYRSMFAISFLIMIFGGLYALINMNKSKGSSFIKFFVIILISLFGLFFANKFMSFLNNYLDSLDTVISQKLSVILNLNDYGSIESTGSLGARIELYLQSLYVWLDNPFFGIAHLYEFDTTKMVGAGLGNHSEWLDVLAKHGLFSFLLLIYLFYPRKAYMNNQGFKFAFVLFIIAGFINPMNLFNIYFVVYFCAPFIDDYFFVNNTT
jgi:hypothetical protein